ncbi:MAG: DUF4892 domain-containing protein [Pseudomonadales bacterium]|nr:DUF4892 domain-containing protein [Pseudomonadales bacterium]
MIRHKPSLYSNLLSASLLMVFASVVSAQATDHPLISGFPDSEIISAEFESDSNYSLVLGRLQRSRGVVIPENSERLRGDVTRLIYEISLEFNGEDVQQFFQEQFAERGYEQLFNCAGRECGSSNYWANDIFRNRVLYGPERNQYFTAVRINSDISEPSHLVLYIITRGNRRIYAYLEIVQPPGTATPVELASSELLVDIEQSLSVVVPGLTFTNDRQLDPAADLSGLASEIQNTPERSFYVVAHLTGPQELEQLLNRSTIRAQTIRQQLINLGVVSSQLIARGLGPLAPSCSAGECLERVELVLIQSND